MVWDLKNNPIHHQEVEIYKYVKKLSGDPEFAHNVSRFVDLRSYLDSHKFKDGEDLRKNVVSNGVPIFSKSEADHLFVLLAKTGGGVADNIVNGWVQYMYEWQPSFIQEGIDVISPYLFITKTLESGELGPIFSIALDSITALLPAIGTSLQTITPEVIGFLPIPEAGPVGAIIGWMLSSVFVVLGMLLNISRQHFGQAFIISFLLVPFLGTALYNGALSGEKFAEKTAARREKLVKSVGDLYGETAGEVIDGVIPEIGEEQESIPVPKINVLDKLGVPEALRSLANTVEDPKGGKRLSRHKHSKGKWRTQRKLR
jgi:hypothetical protein